MHHPRRLWLRKALFQIHLWLGLLLALYLMVIALTGAVLVYRQELTRWGLPPNFHDYSPDSTADPAVVINFLRHDEPGAKASNLQLPSPAVPAFLLDGKDNQGQPTRWVGDPVTGHLELEPHGWLDTVLDIHDYLLLPHSWGMQVNGIGAAGLLVLAATGIFLWWPGVRVWTRGLRVNLRAHWRRLNYDLHHALGFWTLLIVSWWAVSGVYFGWYRGVTAFVAIVSPLRGMLAPGSIASPAPSPAGVPPSLRDILQAAHQASPEGRIWSVSDPTLKGTDSYVLLDLRAPGDFSHRDIVRIREADAKVLSVWHYGERHTAGDWFLWSMHPLHFGTVWGPYVKLVWSTLGVSLAALTFTGVLMYWNRYLRHRWRGFTTALAQSEGAAKRSGGGGGS